MIDIGVASPSAHGHAMIKHRDRVDQAVSTNLSDLTTGSRVVAESRAAHRLLGVPLRARASPAQPLLGPEAATDRGPEARDVPAEMEVSQGAPKGEARPVSGPSDS